MHPARTGRTWTRDRPSTQGVARARCTRSGDRRTQQRWLTGSTEHRRDGAPIQPRDIGDPAGGHDARARLRRHARVTSAMMSERRARVLRAAGLVPGLVGVMRKIGVTDQMHRCLSDFGHTRNHREQERDGDQKPHVRKSVLCSLDDAMATPRASSAARGSQPAQWPRITFAATIIGNHFESELPLLF